jgi:hypothetical protein
MVSYWIGLAFYYTNSQIAWRFPVTFQCIFTFAMSVPLHLSHDKLFRLLIYQGRWDGLLPSSRIPPMASLERQTCRSPCRPCSSGRHDGNRPYCPENMEGDCRCCPSFGWGLCHQGAVYPWQESTFQEDDVGCWSAMFSADLGDQVSRPICWARWSADDQLDHLLPDFGLGG